MTGPRIHAETPAGVPRQLPGDAYEKLKALTRRLVKIAGGVEHAAKLTRVGKSELSDYGNPNSPKFMPADIIADLESEVGEGILTAGLARLLEDGMSKHGALGPVELGAAVTVALGEFQSAALAAIEDGHIDNHELDDLISAAAETMLAAQRAHDELTRHRTARRPALAVAE